MPPTEQYLYTKPCVKSVCSYFEDQVEYVPVLHSHFIRSFSRSTNLKQFLVSSYKNKHKTRVHD